MVTLCQSALATDARSKKGWEKAEITAPSVPTTATGCSYAYTSTGNVHCLNVCLYIYINIPSMQYTLCSIYIHLYRYLYANLPSSNEQIRKGWEHPTVFLFPTRPDDIPSVLWSGLGTALYYAFNFLPARFWQLAAELSSSSSVPRKSWNLLENGWWMVDEWLMNGCLCEIRKHWTMAKGDRRMCSTLHCTPYTNRFSWEKYRHNFWMVFAKPLGSRPMASSNSKLLYILYIYLSIYLSS